VARLKLKNPQVRSLPNDGTQWEVLEVSVDVPVPHLDGVYSYRAPKDSALFGSVVKVPFGQGETYGFVVNRRDEIQPDPSIKRIVSVLHELPLFDKPSFERYQRISETYGASLFTILSFANPAWRKKSVLPKDQIDPPRLEPSRHDRNFIERVFGSDGLDSRKLNLVLPIGVLWEQVAISFFLSRPAPTLILVPTERHLRYLDNALKLRGFQGQIRLSSTMKKSERAMANHSILHDSPILVIGTRSAALAPFKPDRVIVVDPGDENHRERRTPQFRVDDALLWKEAEQLITLSYVRNLDALAEGERFVIGRRVGKTDFRSSTMDRIITDLSTLGKQNSQSLWVLVSLNDKSFASGLICASCRNKANCECGFPFHVARRGEAPRCRKCLQDSSHFSCRHCGGSALKAIRGGGEALGLSVGKSLKGSRVIMSNANGAKDDVIAGESKVVVIATQGCEPRIRSEDGSRVGYDCVVMIGGRAAYSSSSISRSDRFRIAWSRLMGLANPKHATFLIDLDQSHPEFIELKEPGSPRGADFVLQERSQLNLPPFSTLVELRGEDRVLQRLRSTLESDEIFREAESVIFPVHDGRLYAKIGSNQRVEMLRLLQEMTRMRSAKRLPRIDYTFDPEDM